MARPSKKTDEALPDFVIEALLGRGAARGSVPGGSGGGDLSEPLPDHIIEAMMGRSSRGRGGSGPPDEDPLDGVLTPEYRGGGSGSPTPTPPDEFAGSGSGPPPVEGASASEEFSSRRAGSADRDRLVEELRAAGLLRGEVADVVGRALQGTYNAQHREDPSLREGYGQAPMGLLDFSDTPGEIVASPRGIEMEEDTVSAPGASIDMPEGEVSHKPRKKSALSARRRKMAERRAALKRGERGGQ